MLLYYSLAAALPLLTLGDAQAPSAAAAGGTWPADIVGTWVTKSRKTVTGPDFYNPIADEFIEPDKTGISYSFTADGYYEEAYYRAISNPTEPRCASGIMQWQHGSWVMNANGSLSLTPIEVDGRQLTSAPCNGDTSIYVRYNQSELMKQYSVYIDPYHNVPRLDLFQFDGSPIQPLYQMYDPPQMLPTTTLNPITSSSASATAAAKAKRNAPRSRPAKRSVQNGREVPLNWKSKLQSGEVVHRINADRLWWVGLAMTGIGGMLYLGPRRMGVQLSGR